MSRRSTIEPRFFETYHYADTVKGVLSDPFEYGSLLNDFYCDGQIAFLLKPFPKHSAFHAFLGFVVDRLIAEAMEAVDLDDRRRTADRFAMIPEALADLDPLTLPVERALKFHRIDFESFHEWLEARQSNWGACTSDDLGDYFADVQVGQPYEDLIKQSVREAFFVLFANRELLLRFNQLMANEVKDLEAKDLIDEDARAAAGRYLEQKGILGRARMPKWARKAVFFRDRGHCVACRADLTGLVSLWGEENFDHMVPLACGGLNDITNIQLLCGRCNRRKADGLGFTSSKYEDWYAMD